MAAASYLSLLRVQIIDRFTAVPITNMMLYAPFFRHNQQWPSLTLVINFAVVTPVPETAGLLVWKSLLPHVL